MAAVFFSAARSAEFRLMGKIGRISIICGTRPEAIKLAPVALAMKGDDAIECSVCATGQHREMLAQALAAFGIVPDADLNLMTEGQTLASLTAKAVEALDSYLVRFSPDLVLVQGDTTTVFCAALASFYRRIPVGHVEAGLRTGNMFSPWPEEANRVITSRLATLHFAPTESSRRNLLAEGVPEERIFVTGNTAIDALFLAMDRIRRNPSLAETPEIMPFLRNRDRKMVLITGHRRENFGAGIENICLAIAELADRFPTVHFVYPVHLNPNVREPVKRTLGGESRKNIHLIEPLGYLPFVAMMERADVILTDSGGIQEEAPSLGKPVLVMRDVTERPEAVEAGFARLVGADRNRIVSETSKLLDGSAEAGKKAAANPYGDGHAAARIVSICKRFLADRTATGATF
jgi:UDP-N-acetylglucosamine 2-epimerase (non-hydrolysing)